MEKIAFILEGKANKGKTSTIKEVVEIINNKNNIALIEKIKEDNSLEKVDIKKALEPYDISLIIHLNIGDNRIRIGIESKGDPDDNNKEKLLSSLEKFKEKECDIILCAIRDSSNEASHKLYKNVNIILGNVDIEVKLSDTKIKIEFDYEHFKTIFGNKNNKNIYKRMWITNIYEEDKKKRTKANKKSAELIYELIEKAIKELSE